MFNDTYFYETKFKLSLNTIDLDLSNEYTVLDTNKYNQKTMITCETIDMFDQIGLKITYARLFCCPPFSVGQLHVDGDHRNKNNKGAVNFVLNDYANWTMNWYSYPEDAPVTHKYSKWGINTENTNVITSTAMCGEYATEIEKHTFSNACLVRIDVPHKIINVGNQPRYCITIRFQDNDYLNLLEILKSL